MFQLLKKSFHFIRKQKKLLVLIVALTILLFSLRFPWNHLLEKTVKDFQKKSPSFLQTDFDKLRLRFFPPGAEFKNLSINLREKNIFLDSLRVSMVLSKWLAFKKAWKFEAVKADSSLSVMFWRKEKVFKDDPEERPVVIYFVEGHSPLLKLQALDSLFPNMRMSGVVETRFSYEGSLEREQDLKAFLSLKGKDILLSQTEIHTPLGPLSFPPIQWKEGEVVLRLKEGEVIFQTFRLGSSSDDFIIQMKGSGAVFFSYGRVRLNSYNVQLQIDVAKSFQMSLLDLMFAGYKEDKGSFYRYRLRLTGQGNQVPNMEKLTEF